MRRYELLALMILPVPASDLAYAGDTLEVFAQKCDLATGVTVPDFNCDAGTLVPTDHHTSDKCDRPQQLAEVCDPGSRFQVLTPPTSGAYVLAHCRKTGLGAGQYSDIAVIQHNKTNGATCFYQGAVGALDNNGNVKAPSKGVGSPAFWMTPTEIVNSTFPCVQCHDNGPIIRSPYLTHLTGPNTLPGAHNNSFNLDQPYSFVGSDFASWKAYKVEIPNVTTCTSCHRLGVSNAGGGGTAREFAIRATAKKQKNKNDHSAQSPIWMPPGKIHHDQFFEDAAKALKLCADQFVEGALPNTLSCRITQFSGSPLATGLSIRGWQGLGGGSFTSGPAVAARAANHLDVFGRGTDDALYHNSWTGSSWGGWKLVAPNKITSDPVAIARSAQTIDVFARGTDNKMYHIYWDGTGW